MKKILLISIIISAIFTSCEDDVINTLENNAIQFNDAYVEKNTRSNDCTTENLTSFIVYGWMFNDNNESVQILDQEVVSRNGGVWSYNQTQYWFANKRFEFTAIAPFSSAQYSLAGNDGTLSFTNNATTDLVLATDSRTIDNNLDATDVRPVAFSFEHLLSRLVVQFRNDFTAGDVNLLISNVKIAGLAKNATLAFDNNQYDKTVNWVLTDDETFSHSLLFPTTTVNRETSKIDIPAKTETISLPFYIISETISADNQYTLTFDVEITQSDVRLGNYTHTVTLTPMTFEKGVNYKLSAVLNSTNVNPESNINPITFTVEVLPWGEDQHGEVNFPNE